MRNVLIAVTATFTALAAPAQDEASAGGDVEIREWQVPWASSRPRDPAVADDGRIWFVGQAADYVAVFDPADESFERFDLPEGAGPHNVIVTDDQEIWYAGNRAAHLGRLDPETGAVEQVVTPEDGARDPHTLIEDSKGRIWFTSQWANHIGRYDRESGKIDLVGVSGDRSRPYGIVIDDDDNAWIALFGTNRLGFVDGESFELTEIELPREEARPRRLAWIGSGIYYGDYNKGFLGHYAPETGEFREWAMPGGEQSGPYAFIADDRDRLWFVETWQEPNRLVGFDPESEEFFAMGEVPSGGGTVRHMVFDPESGSIWFGTDTNYLGRASIP